MCLVDVIGGRDKRRYAAHPILVMNPGVKTPGYRHKVTT